MGTPLVLTQQIDSTTWQALGLVLTLLGLGISVVVWRARGAGHGLRAVAWSLVPLAAGLTGLLRLAWEVLDSLLEWAVRLVFSPLVWLGVAVAVVALLLHVAGGVLVRRAHRTGSGRTGVSGAPRAEVHGTRPAPVSSRPASGKQPRKQRKQDDQLVDDQDDIEAILRKHGIS